MTPRNNDNNKDNNPSGAKHPPDAIVVRSDLLQHPYVVAGAGIALLVHLSALLSLPPAIMGRGAPFLPTTSKHGNAMFQQLQEQLAKSTRLQQKLQQKSLQFVDLGSGDGRLVFQAARQGIFHSSVGYEINPVLHGVAHTRRLLQAPTYWKSTQFRLKDIWKVNLQHVDVVAVYGLTPIMKPLGVKLQQELAPGSIVISNVFAFPGWKPESTSPQGTHLYVVPPIDKEGHVVEETVP